MNKLNNIIIKIIIMKNDETNKILFPSYSNMLVVNTYITLTYNK